MIEDSGSIIVNMSSNILVLVLSSIVCLFIPTLSFAPLFLDGIDCLSTESPLEIPLPAIHFLVVHYSTVQY